jgi:hypothetical protein
MEWDVTVLGEPEPHCAAGYHSRKQEQQAGAGAGRIVIGLIGPINPVGPISPVGPITSETPPC